jgi:GTPase SAR1 family protein
VPEIVKNNGGKVPVMVLCGLKSDLRESDPGNANNCSDEDIEATRVSIQAKASIACSAKTRNNVTEVFTTALKYHFECNGSKGGGGSKGAAKDGGGSKTGDGGGGCCTIL